MFPPSLAPPQPKLPSRPQTRPVRASSVPTSSVDAPPAVAESAPEYPALSYELYPPRSSSAGKVLWETVRCLEETAPDFVSVTYGASGSNRDTAVGLVERLSTQTSLKPLAHLTCIGNTRDELAGIVDELVTSGVRGVLALRGDASEPEQEATPTPEPAPTPRGGLRYAQQLVELIRQVERRRAAQLCGGRMAIGVAAYPVRHPESPSFEHDIEVLLAKQGAGADFAITQVFFRPEQYRLLVTAARRAGVDIPIIPGIMPQTSVRRLDRLAEIAGIEADSRLRDRLVSASEPAARRRVGIAATVELASDVLAAGAPGIHLYTFNEHHAALEVLERLDLRRPAQTRHQSV